ncbi:rRNA-processing protein UTP23 homolog [Tachyglossus aculeatus]|uniref:rRNA-processing protein UTP23 homolog n=1 Tax=Tachyglossus aculeatus TaxID=9261 RepID=UPI0018F45762|nr:rRNA-processing protein UTP23 homolog [Tachyglossus aculeatus]
MKVKRQKHAKKHLAFYRHNFGFREPYQLLLDGTFCQAALRGRVLLREQLPRYLLGQVQLCTTRCVLKELESLGKELYGAKLIAQRFQVRSCSHFKNAVGGSECLLSMIEAGNPHRYFVATQDHGVSAKVKRTPGVPLLFIIQNTIVLDKPSPDSTAFVKAAASTGLVSDHQKQIIERLKEEQGLGTGTEPKKRKRKRAGGPNPLSCLKKKKKKAPDASQPAARKNKRKRNRIRNRGKTPAVQPERPATEA